MGRRAFGFSSGLAVNVGKLEPGPHKIIACSPGAAMETAWGILRTEGVEAEDALLVGDLVDDWESILWSR